MQKTLKNNFTQGDLIEQFLTGIKGGIATLKEIYHAIPNAPRPSLRRTIRQDERFKSIARGVYYLANEKCAGLLIEGDGRTLNAIEDESIQLIVTDHPWKDDKALKGGNRNFSNQYVNTSFNYTQEDFYQKARVLEEGGYLVEFLPTESETNYEYLYQIKQMAKKAGFKYYAKIMWQKSPSNTGRTVKEFEDIMIFTKGKPKRLNDKKSNPYFTKEMLKQRLPFSIPKKVSDKRHQAEKPVALFEYLIDMLSEEGAIVLDQFGGSCNCLEAALNKNRFAIVYECMGEFIDRAVNRLKATPLFSIRETSNEFLDVDSNNNTPKNNLSSENKIRAFKEEQLMLSF